MQTIDSPSPQRCGRRSRAFTGRTYADALQDNTIGRLEKRPKHPPIFGRDDRGADIVVVQLTNGPAKVVLDRADYDALVTLGISPNWFFRPADSVPPSAGASQGKLCGLVRAALRGASGNTVTIARVIVGAGKGDRVTYADENPLNLRRSNLTLARRLGG